LGAVQVEISQAAPDLLSVLATLFGRTSVDEPMMRWPLGGHGDVEERLTRCFEWFLERLIGPQLTRCPGPSRLMAGMREAGDLPPASVRR
jgi:hypothetical protein